MKQNKQQVKNKWKKGTIFLLIVCVILLIILLIKIKIEIGNLKAELCQATDVVPAYVSAINKKVLFTGYKGKPEPGVVDALINEEIAFVYRSGCLYCAKQIEDFGDEWEKYQKEGITVDCAKLK